MGSTLYLFDIPGETGNGLGPVVLRERNRPHLREHAGRERRAFLAVDAGRRDLAGSVHDELEVDLVQAGASPPLLGDADGERLAAAVHGALDLLGDELLL